MTMVEEIGNALANEFSWLTLPVNGAPGNLFYDKMPDTPDEAVAIYQYGGGNPVFAFNNTILYETPRLQVLVRHAESDIAKSQSYEILKFLAGIVDQTLSGVKYISVTPLGSPGKLGPDDKNRERFTVNYDVWKALS